MSLELVGTVQQAIAAPICHEQITDIVPQLLADLPSYGNRVIQRSRQLSREEDTYSYIVTTSPADFRPLPLRTQQYTPAVPDTTTQIFFTTLEKQYSGDRQILSENYYWLFVTPIDQNRWAIAHLVSSLSHTDPQLATPPRDASQSSIGQAIKLWLRDYNANCTTDH